MNRNSAIAVITLGLWLGSAHAVPGNYSIIQSQTFSDSFSNFDPSGASNSLSFNTPRVATINPFSSYATGSGTLNSVTITWNTSWSFSGTTTPGNAGSVNINGGGTAFVGSDAYNGMGGGNGSSAPQNSPISVSASWAGSSPSDYVFSLPWSCCYNPNIATVFTGANPYTVAYGSAADGSGSWGTFSYGGIASGLVSAQSQVTVKYDYFGEAVSVPVAATPVLLGIGLFGIAASRRKRDRC